MNNLKFCTKCDIEKPKNEFGKQKSNKDGLYYWCKLCVKIQNQLRKSKPKIQVTQQKCRDCKKIKSIVHFPKSSAEVTGYQKQCLKCKSAEYNRNGDGIRARRKLDRRTNPHRKLQEQKWRDKNIDKVLANRKRYASEHKGQRAAHESKRRAQRKVSTQNWSDKEYIKDLFVNCREAEQIFLSAGVTVKFNVDHIYPLKGKIVSGLHNEFNLQILTEHENFVKYNSYPSQQLLTSLGG